MLHVVRSTLFWAKYNMYSFAADVLGDTGVMWISLFPQGAVRQAQV
jgi:hypothetical protein